MTSIYLSLTDMCCFTQFAEAARQERWLPGVVLSPDPFLCAFFCGVVFLGQALKGFHYVGCIFSVWNSMLCRIGRPACALFTCTYAQNARATCRMFSTHAQNVYEEERMYYIHVLHVPYRGCL